MVSITVNGAPVRLPVDVAPACADWSASWRSKASGSPSKRTARSCREPLRRHHVAPAIESRSSPPSAAARSTKMNAPTETRPDARRPAGHRRGAYRSRLLVGTGKYRDFAQTREAIDASGAEIVTVAIRRTNIGQNAERAVAARLPAAVRVHATCPTPPAATPPTTRCARCGSRASCSTATRWCKLEVLGDTDTLLPGRAARRYARPRRSSPTASR